MADCCYTPSPLTLDPHRGNASAYRRVLWAVLTINAVMFLVEIGAGFVAGSASLQADALDFFGDAVGNDFVGLAREIQMMPVSEVSAVGEVQAENGVAGLEDRIIGAHVRLRS